jgi:hypothetical protein
MKAIAQRDPSLAEINWDFKQLEADLRRVLDNHANGRAGADGIGDTRRNAVNALLGIGTKTNRAANPLTGLGGKGSALKTLRLDAFDDIAGTGRQGFSFDYQKANGNFMPDAPAPRPDLDTDLPVRMPQQIPREAQGMPDVGPMRKRRVYRGVSPDMDYSSGDQFWSTSKEVAENYAFQTQSPGRIDTSLTTDLPQNLYRATNKDELRNELGIKAEPYSFEFDAEVKAALQAQGYEGVRYNAGTDLGGDQAMELHIFGKPKPSAAPRGQAMPDAAPADAPPFYMKSAQVLDSKIQGKAATVDQVRAILKNPQNGIKAEELKWTGIEQAVERIAKENGGKVPKEALLRYLQEDGAVRLEEVRMRDVSEIDVPAQWEQQRQEEILRARAEEYARQQGRSADDVYDEIIRDAAELSETMNEARIEWLDSVKEPPTKFGQYQLPGGENYREVVLAMPNVALERAANNLRQFEAQFGSRPIPAEAKPQHEALRQAVAAAKQPETYTSKHFDTPNYVAHMRLNERTDAAGKPGLFLEEVQSDRHQAGREQGYREPFEQWIAFYDAGGTEVPIGYGRSEKQALESIDKNWEGLVKIQTRKRDGVEGIIPDAPFRKDWPMQMFKRALADAVGSGKEWIGWTTGETQAARYDLSKQVDALDYQKNQDGTYQLSFQKDRRGNMIGESIPADKLEEYVGKDVAQKITEGVGDDVNFAGNNEPRNIFKRLAGLNLKVGGEGMKGFYDQILPKEISKYVKQWGGQVEKSRIGEPKKGTGKLTRDEVSEARREAKQLIRGDISVEEFNDNWGTRLTDEDVPGNDPYREPRGVENVLDFVRDQRKQEAGGTFEAWRVNITPQMRESIKKAGQALFVGGMAAVVAEQEEQ